MFETQPRRVPRRAPARELSTVRARGRFIAYLRSSQLDRELARGLPCDTSRLTLVRAEMLVQPAMRRDLSRSISRCLTGANRSGPQPRWVPVRNRQAIRDATQELALLIDRLRADRPLALRGIAQSALLVSDARSPLYQGDGEALRGAAAAALEALDDLA